MPLLIEKKDGIGQLTLSRPEARNAWGDDYNTGLPRILEEWEDDDDVRCVILTGDPKGKAFSAGADLRNPKTHATNDTASFITKKVTKNRHFAGNVVSDFPKPVIAAVNGLAMGGGFELTLACDIRVAEEGDYEMGLPEITVGILPGAGGTQKLARLVGMARALEMTLRGRTVSPSEALALGIVQELAPPGGALDAAKAMAREMASKPARASGHIKRLVRASLETPLDEGLALERTLFLDLMVTDEANRLMSKMNAENLDIRRL